MCSKNTTKISGCFHQISCNDKIFLEYVHDRYKSKGGLPDPTVCSQCGAVNHKGRWQWRQAPPGTHHATCPACLRIHDHYPAGFLSSEGVFFLTHRDEVMHLVHNVERQENIEYPLKRIMVAEGKKKEILVTTTDIYLARDIGVALQHTYHGDLEFRYNPRRNQLHVIWI